MTSVWLATEDALSEAVAERLLLETGQHLEIAGRLGGTGSGYLSKNLQKFIQMAHAFPVFLLTDLDRIECPPSLVASWCKGRSLPKGLVFRVAVRETEAWLMADRDGFSTLSGIPKSKLTHDAEGIQDPKETLLGLVRRYGRKDVKADLLPVDPSQTARRGMNYNDRLSAFVRDPDGWNPARAAQNADSLRRARERLAAFPFR
ncbi:DUF4276 family protein [Roseospira navarrensis]|uniref:DUF4276 family protein n=1 Tax=Roseospira navarrensis TaxID=140058 RepID=A0A7X1ZD83_9PROT|nr:DUF4276 family protein [Roseospira navarrensis]MQX36395.1 DUF4276 family protein [Roseospira navarrensis]